MRKSTGGSNVSRNPKALYKTSHFGRAALFGAPLAVVALFGVGCAAEQESWTSPPRSMAAYPPNGQGQPQTQSPQSYPQQYPQTQYPGAQTSQSPSGQAAPTWPTMLGSAVSGVAVAVQGLPQILSIPTQLPASWPFPWPGQGNGQGGQGGNGQNGGTGNGGQQTGNQQTGNGQSGLPSSSDAWPTEWISFEDQVLQLTNAERARGAVCGGQQMSPVGPLTAETHLRAAARGHSTDMGKRGYFEHNNPEGMDPSQRAQAAGFPSTFVGENIAAGQPTPESVMQAWMKSPGHCLNIMDGRYKTLGVGYSFDSNTQYGHYWTQDFGD
ncbi:MAG: CAP domain-containing protein [Polyangiaceae bacterium]